MSTDERIRNRRGFRSPMLLLGITMTLIYVALALWILLDKSFLTGIPTEFRNIFAVMLLGYGVFRGWRVYSDYF
ncbi:MAG: hypothetical protein IPK76_14875 [Lewinellaceae bacterium]|nr:hypothetical protein [Lewinellaceae bacterium]